MIPAMLPTPGRGPGAGAIDPAGRPVVLYVVHRLPYPPDKGDRIRASHLLRMLAKRCAVHLACLADEPPVDGAVAALQGLCERVAVVRVGRWARLARAAASMARGRTATEGAFHSPALRETLRGWARRTRYHAALASASSMAPYLRLPEFRDVPCVIDLVDVDSEKWFEYAGSGRDPRSRLYRIEGDRLRSLERGLPDWARAVTLISEAELELYRRFCPGEGAHWITNGVDLDEFRPWDPPVHEQGCVFVGALDYRPNVDGARWFCKLAWPELRRRHPGATLSLVGRHPAPSVSRLGREPGVEVIGTVPDVRHHMAAAAVAVVPLRIARGVQNKVLEAMAMGKAVVASPQALSGLRAEPGVHALVASTPGEWVEAVSCLLNDESLRRRLGASGRRYVEDHHSWEACLEPFGSLLGLPLVGSGEGAARGHPPARGTEGCSPSARPLA